MKSCRKHILAAALGLVAAQAPGVASALVSWTFDTANCMATVGPDGNCGSGDNNFSDGRIYQGTGDAGNVTVSGWANTISNNKQLELGQITHYSGGIGVRNADAPPPDGRGGDDFEGTPPEHAVDNDQRFDLVLFDFGDQLIELSQITLGWFSQDSDLSLLAYTGDLDPTDGGGAHFIGDREAWWNSNTDKNEDLTTHGWSLIGNHDVDDTPPSSTEQAINPGKVASNYWIVSAYNPVFASNCTPENNYCQSDYADYFKIMTLAGNVRQPPDQVPEPAPVLFLAAALLFTRRVRARRH